MGFTLSHATARYESADGGQSIDADISDFGGIGMGMMAMAAWSMAEFDRTTQDGYERTTTFDGHKALEKETRYDDRVDTELTVIVDNRLIVQLTGTGVDMDRLHDAARDIDLDDLAGEL
jgi:hypothetical protein